jgi:HEAT repeat protein
MIRAGIVAVGLTLVLLTQLGVSRQPNKGELFKDKTLEQWITALQAPDRDTRVAASEALLAIGAKAKGATGALIRALNDEDGLVRYNAVQALSKLGADAVPDLIKVFQSPNGSLRYYAGSVLVKAGPAAKAALPELKKALAFPDPGTRLVAIKILGSIGAGAAEAVPDLALVLKDDEEPVRKAAINALGKIGPPAKSVEKDIAALLKDPSDSIRKEAAAALAKISPPKGTKIIDGQLAATDPLDKVRKQMHHKVHTVAMMAGQVYVIDLQSNDFDSWLRLEDAAGKQLAQDDDGGGFPHARITFTAPATADYRLIVTTYAPGKTGTYTLKVQPFGGNQ